MNRIERDLEYAEHGTKAERDLEYAEHELKCCQAQRDTYRRQRDELVEVLKRARSAIGAELYDCDNTELSPALVA